MTTSPLTLHIHPQVQTAFSSLGAEDRRLVEAWFDHIRNWHNDDFIRSRSRRLKLDEELYAFQTSSDDIVIVFRISADEVTVLSILRSEWLRPFEKDAQGTAL